LCRLFYLCKAILDIELYRNVYIICALIITVMVLWRRKKSRKVRNDLGNVGRRIKGLKKIESKAEELKRRIGSIISKIDEAKKDIVEEAESEKLKVWLDSRYDGDIDKLVEKEIKELEGLKERLSDLRQLVDSNVEDIADVIELLIAEESKLEVRIEENKKEIEKWETETLAQRMRTSSVVPPVGSTSDRVSFANIVRVARQLGGWCERGGHGGFFSIQFPMSLRPIPLSHDVSSTALAGQITIQLTHLPDYKRPTSTKLRGAFRRGDIRSAA